MSSAYLPPPRGTLTGMFNAWVWSLANVTAKASCSRSPCVRVNGMFNALVWSFDFDVEWSVNLCSRLVVSFCILLSDWFFFRDSEWLIGRKWRLLIDQISRLLIGWRWNTSQSFYHPIICFVDRCLSFVLFLLAIVLYVLLQYTDSDYPFDFLPTLLHTHCLVESVLLIYLVFLLCGVPNVGSVSLLPFLVFITFL